MDRYQIIGTDECGQEFFVANNLKESQVSKKLKKARETYEEARGFSVELMVDYYARAQSEYDDERYL